MGHRALITGVLGQDGYYLSENLLRQGWEVHGFVRESDWKSSKCDERLILHAGDLSDTDSVHAAIQNAEPDVIFNLGGLSSVAQSWDRPVETGLVSGVAVVGLLDASLRLQNKLGRKVRFVQASSSEMFGDPVESPQNENTLIRPVSPYGAAKAYAHHMVKIYRDRGLFAASAILYNHESIKRPESFVTRKITSGVAKIAAGVQDRLVMGNIHAKRDWGWAPDYVEALVRISQAEKPDDFVIATGESHSVRDFIQVAFETVGISEWERFVEIDQKYFRPEESAEMRGDAGRARAVLNWQPTKGFTELVRTMTRHDANLLGDTRTSDNP